MAALIKSIREPWTCLMTETSLFRRILCYLPNVLICCRIARAQKGPTYGDTTVYMYLREVMTIAMRFRQNLGFPYESNCLVNSRYKHGVLTLVMFAPPGEENSS